MANDKIKKSDLIGKINLNAEIKALEELLEVTGKLKKETKELAKSNLSEAIGIDVSTIKGIKELEKAKDELAKTTARAQKVDEKEKKIKKALKDLTDEELEQAQKQKIADSERVKMAKLKAVANSKEAGTLEKLNAQNAKNRLELKKLNLETEEGRKRQAELIEQIEKNTETIRENSDAYVQQKMNIGNYTDSMTKALSTIHPMLGAMVEQGKASLESLKGIRLNTKSIKNNTKAIKKFLVSNLAKIKSIKASDLSAKSLNKTLKKTAKDLKNVSKNTKIAKNGFISLGKTAKKVGKTGLLALVGILAGFVTSMADTREGLEMTAGTVEKFTKSAKALFSKLFYDVRSGFLGMSLFINEGLLDIQKAVSTYVDIQLVDEEAVKAMRKQKNALDANSKAIGNYSDIWANADSATKGSFIDRWNRDDLFMATAKKIAVLTGELEILEEKMGDDTLDMREKLKANDEYFKKLKQVIDLEQQRADAVLEANLAEVRKDLPSLTKEQLLEKMIAGDPVIVRKLGIDNMKAVEEALTAVQEVQNKFAVARQKALREQRMTEQDAFEQDLDYAIDIFDKQKTINERQIANEKLTLEERAKILADTDALAKKSFENQIKLVEDHTKQKIDFDKLVALQDEEETRREIAKITTSEIVKKRIMEIINERKLANQDLAEAQDYLADQRLQKDIRIAEDQASINEIASEDYLYLLDTQIAEEEKRTDFRLSVWKKLQEDKLQAQKDQIAEELRLELERIDTEIVEDDEAKKAKEEAQAEHNSKLLRLTTEHGIKVKSEEQKAFEERKALLEKYAGQLKKHLLEVNAMRAENLKEDLDASKKQEDRLQALADQRVLGAEESLSAEKEAQAQIQKELARTEKRKQIIEASMTALKLVASYAEKGINNPTSKAGKDIATLMTAVKGIQFFAEGTESVEGGVKGVDSVPAMLMPQERVFTVEQNKRIGNISNDDASRILEAHRKGAFEGTVLPTATAVRTVNNDDLAKKVSKPIIDAIKNIPVASVDHHALADYITNTIRTQNTIERRHYKGNQIFK